MMFFQYSEFFLFVAQSKAYALMLINEANNFINKVPYLTLVNVCSTFIKKVDLCQSSAAIVIVL